MDVFYFLTSVSLGILSGIVYDILYIVRCFVCGVKREIYSVKDRIFTIVCDIIFCLIVTAAYIFVSVIFSFDELRLFMIVGVLMGILLYLKSFHIIVAFFVNKLYNKLRTKKTDKDND